MAAGPGAAEARRITAPVAGLLRRAAALSVAAGLLWPAQAAVLAGAIAGWVAGGAFRDSLIAAAAVLALGLVRAGLEHRAGGLLFRAADRTIARLRARLIGQDLRAPAAQGSAGTAALIVQKLPLLHPWIARYHVAAVRVAVLPGLLALLAFTQSWAAGLILLAAGPLVPLFMALVGAAAEGASRRHLAEIGTMNGMLMERLAALLDIRLLGAADRAAADFAIRAETLRERTMAVLRLAFLSSTVLELVSALGVAMMAVYVGFSLLGGIGIGTWGPPLTLAQGLFLLLIAPEFFQPLRDLAAAWHDRAAGLAVAAELAALEAAPRAPMPGTGAPAAPLPGPLALRLEGAAAALSGRSVALPDLTLRAGEALALTGPSGAGKTTALRAIAGLLPLAAGRIEICGRALDGTTADAWRARLAWLPQRPHFPDLPLARILDPSGAADPWPALERARVREVAAALPQGLETRLGEDGGGVSGGEARRLMLARVLLTRADLILADEPTADLDPATAADVTAVLLALRAEGRALLVATHDPALVAALGRCVEMPG